MGLPSRSDELLDRIEGATDGPLNLLALALIPLILAPRLFDFSETTTDALNAIGYMIWGCFAAVFLVCLLVATDRRSYLRAHWFDAALVILPMFRPLRALRIAGVLVAAFALGRLLATGRELSQRKGIQFVAIAGLLTIVVGGMAVTAAERGQPDSSIQDIDDGLWWAVTTVTTVGYGDTYPRTAEGRGIGVALMLIGIALFGAITANLAAYLVEKKEDTSEALLREILAELRDGGPTNGETH